MGAVQILLRSAPELAGDDELIARIQMTLNLMHRWGYAPRIEDLARQLLGGSAPVEAVAASAGLSDSIRLDQGFVVLAGAESLLGTSRERSKRNQVVNGGARALAREFVTELSRHCPFVECIALSGSVASGGYVDGDDVDFDLVVKDGTKYTVYLLANLLGLRYSYRLRKRTSDPLHRIVFLPKVICINVVWTNADTRPFRRQDAGLAFELLRCEPLAGMERFSELLVDNPWLDRHLPQARARRWPPDVRPIPSPLSRLLSRVYARPAARRTMERLCRGVAHAMYRVAQELRPANAETRERMEFLRNAKYPYEVFQD